MAEEKYSPTTRPLAFWKTSANVRDNPVAIGVGVLAVFSQLNFVLLFVLTKLGLVTLPPLNAFTAITNAAMEERVQAGTLDKMVATGWANRFNFDLIKQFYARRLCHAATVHCMPALAAPHGPGLSAALLWRTRTGQPNSLAAPRCLPRARLPDSLKRLRPCALSQASGAPDDFVLKYCMDKMEPEHFNWCLAAKEVVTGWEGGL